MTKETLEEYPILIDSELDFEATREFIGRGSCVYSIKNLKTKEGTIVYMWQQKESDEEVYDKGKYIGKKCIQGIIVAGYSTKQKGLLSFLKSRKIKKIPEKDKEQIKTTILNSIKKTPDYVEFWN
jgi:hypothetical protein